MPQPLLPRSWSWTNLWRPIRPFRTNTKKDVLFIIGGWNAKVGSQEIPGVTGKFGLGIQNEAGQRLTKFFQENTLVIEDTLFQQHRDDSTHGYHQMVDTEIILIIFFAAKDGEALSVQFSLSVMSNSLRPHRLQHARPPCPSPTPGVYSNSSPLSWWCHPAISSSVVPFYSCLQSFPASGSFPMSQLFTSSGQSIGVSASTSVLPMNNQD